MKGKEGHHHIEVVGARGYGKLGDWVGMGASMASVTLGFSLGVHIIIMLLTWNTMRIFVHASKSTCCKCLTPACEPFVPSFIEGWGAGAGPTLPISQNPPKLPGEHIWWDGGGGSPRFPHLALTPSDTAASTTPAA